MRARDHGGPGAGLAVATRDRHACEISRRRALLTRPWVELDAGDRAEALAAVRDLASEQVSDELDQDARLVAAGGSRLWRGWTIRDPRVDALNHADPRRWTYLDAVRTTRAAYSDDRQETS